MAAFVSAPTGLTIDVATSATAPTNEKKNRYIIDHGINYATFD